MAYFYSDTEIVIILQEINFDAENGESHIKSYWLDFAGACIFL